VWVYRNYSPRFSGYVPRELKDKYPEAKIRLQPGWCGFKGAGQLDPTDALFATLGRDFLEEEKKLYGTYGIYAADPFHYRDVPEAWHKTSSNAANNTL
jgi:alpha-N-acetylglucosaminidase